MSSVMPLPPMHQNPNLQLVLYAPDNRHMARLGATLSGHAQLTWVDSREVSAAQLARTAANTPLILLDYCGGNASYSSELAHQLAASGTALMMIGVSTASPDQAHHLLAALRAGVRDFIDIDNNAAQMLETFKRVSALPVPAAAAVAAAPAPATAPDGRLILLHGVRAGIGTSMLAAHLGTQLAIRCAASKDAKNASNQVLLLDLGQPNGDGALYLGIENLFGYEEALRNVERIDPTFATTALAHHCSGLALLGLSAPALPSAEPATLLKQLRRIFPLTLVDTGGIRIEQLPAALLEQAHEIWLLCDQSIGALVSLDQALRQLQQRELRDDRLRLVVNRYDAEGGLGDEQIAERFSLPLLSTLPERSRALRSSTGLGRLLTENAPRDPYVRALQPLLQHLAGDQAVAAPASPLARLASLLGR